MLGVGTGIVVLVADDDKTFVCVSDERAGQQNSLRLWRELISRTLDWCREKKHMNNHAKKYEDLSIMQFSRHKHRINVVQFYPVVDSYHEQARSNFVKLLPLPKTNIQIIAEQSKWNSLSYLTIFDNERVEASYSNSATP